MTRPVPRPASLPQRALPSVRPPGDEARPVEGFSARALLGLQRSTGNRAVRNLLTAQRAIGDGHDLTSPRFAGEAALEACFDDQARLTQGARGAAVQKVQQALIDLGFDLGPKGADGVYGPKTWDAVKAFKAKERLGFETMGDVGPGTMRRLNELFPAAAPPIPDAEAAEPLDTDEISCPTDDDVVTATSAVGPSTQQALVTAPGEVADAGGEVRAGRKGPVTIDEAVDRFTKKVNTANAATARDGSTANITDRGQFFWSKQILIEIENELAGIERAPGGGLDFATKARKLLVKIQNEGLEEDPTIQVDLAELEATASTANPALRTRMKALLARSKIAGGAIVQDLWKSLESSPDDKIPSLLEHRSIRTFRSVKRFLNTDCFNHAVAVARRVHRKGGVSPRDPKVRPFHQVVGSHDFVSDSRPLKPGEPKGLDDASISRGVDPVGPAPDKRAKDGFMMGHVMRQTGVAGAVSAMQTAIDAGLFVHVRVVSGVGFGGFLGEVQPKGKRTRQKLADVDKKGKPKPITKYEEHSVLVIGYDGNKFVFNDPDAGVSSSPKPGFGLLFFDAANNRLGTGETPDMVAVNENGKNRANQKRYQVISLTSL